MVRFFKSTEDSYYAVHENGSLVVMDDIKSIMVGSWKLSKHFVPPVNWTEITEIEFDLIRSGVLNLVMKATLDVLKERVVA